MSQESHRRDVLKIPKQIISAEKRFVNLGAIAHFRYRILGGTGGWKPATTKSDISINALIIEEFEVNQFVTRVKLTKNVVVYEAYHTHDPVDHLMVEGIPSKLNNTMETSQNGDS